ncbi:MAG: alpha/beta hydrolase [Enterobacterales bacterium]|nr:alpha/beta hydrolase [Enterobacterales bacterium]
MHPDDWFKQGRLLDLEDGRLFILDSGLSDKPTLIILHGFPTSSYDYYKVYQPLTQHYRVILHDHLGFGFSDKPHAADYSLLAQTDRAEAIWQQLGIRQAFVLAHDYGTSILTEMLARETESSLSLQLQGIILCNGSMHIELAKLRLMQRLLRMKVIGPLIAKLSTKHTLKNNLKATYFQPEKLSNEEIEAIWQLMTRHQGRNCLAAISRYTLERHRYWDRWIGALQKTNQSIEIIWPQHDPIAISRMAEVIAAETQHSRLHWIQDCGHFPMLEKPQAWCSQVIDSMTYLREL